LNSAGWKMDHMNDFRIRVILRNIFRPFLLSCPITLAESVIKPFLQNLSPFRKNFITFGDATEQTSDLESKLVQCVYSSQ
jgi:hypothetical protein